MAGKCCCPCTRIHHQQLAQSIKESGSGSGGYAWTETNCSLQFVFIRAFETDFEPSRLKPHCRDGYPPRLNPHCRDGYPPTSRALPAAPWASRSCLTPLPWALRRHAFRLRIERCEKRSQPDDLSRNALWFILRPPSCIGRGAMMG